MNETASKPIIHEVRGYNFHGAYLIRLRGPAEGFELSESQARKVQKTLCGLSSCTCGGDVRYGDGIELGTARVIRGWGDGPWNLLPASRKTDRACHGDEFGHGDWDVIA